MKCVYFKNHTQTLDRGTVAIPCNRSASVTAFVGLVMFIFECARVKLNGVLSLQVLLTSLARACNSSRLMVMNEIWLKSTRARQKSTSFAEA